MNYKRLKPVTSLIWLPYFKTNLTVELNESKQMFSDKRITYDYEINALVLSCRPTRRHGTGVFEKGNLSCYAFL